MNKEKVKWLHTIAGGLDINTYSTKHKLRKKLMLLEFHA